jgi:hypothetical protein
MSANTATWTVEQAEYILDHHQNYSESVIAAAWQIAHTEQA